MKSVNRFIEYTSFDTQSDPTSKSAPTTQKQFVLLKLLVKQLHNLGIDNAHVDEYGNAYAKIASNVGEKGNKIGFIAHVDTSPDMSGEDVKPRIVENYDGKDIVLNEALNIVMSAKDFPSLQRHIGKDLIVTDGTTLLGADDKAGVAIIMTMVEYLIKNNVPHGEVRIAFTSDEEVGRGTDHFDIEKFDADYAYTVDGGKMEAISFENFNAASAEVIIHGKSIHPGDAKDRMVNAARVGIQFDSLLPSDARPECTEGYEGFNHLCNMSGACEECRMSYIIRNHDEDLFNKQKQDFLQARDTINKALGYEAVEVLIEDTYYNMRKLVEPHMEIVHRVEEAMKENGITPEYEAIRGGTDGCRLTYDGLITPNLGTGGYNFHGKYEYLCIQEFQKMIDVVISIVKNNVK